LQGYTSFAKKISTLLHLLKFFMMAGGSIFFAKTLQFSQRTAFWLHTGFINDIFFYVAASVQRATIFRKSYQNL